MVRIRFRNKFILSKGQEYLFREKNRMRHKFMGYGVLFWKMQYQRMLEIVRKFLFATLLIKGKIYKLKETVLKIEQAYINACNQPRNRYQSLKLLVKIEHTKMFSIYKRFKMIHRNRIVEFDKILVILESFDHQSKVLQNYLQQYDNFIRTNYLPGYQIY